MMRSTSRPALQAVCFLLLLTTWGAAHRSFKRHARATGHRVGTSAYDKCSHPFHSWMCQHPSRPRQSPVTILTPSRGKQLTGGAAPDTLPLQGSRVIPQSTAPTPPTPPTTLPTPQHDQASSPEAAPSRGVTPSTLPFPTPSSFPTTAPEPRRGSILFSEPAAAPSTSTAQGRGLLPTKTQPKELQQEPAYDQCSHPFHAWLCSSAARPRPTHRLQVKPRPSPRPSLRPTPRPTPRPTSSRTPRPTLRPTPRPTLRPNPGPTERPTPRADTGPFPEASNSRKGSLLLSQTTRPSPTTTSTTPRSYDICSHPFHSWRCERPRLDRRPSTIGKSVKPPPALPKPTPPPKMQALPTPALPLPEPTWDGTDPCSHAFHSWLCNRSGPRPTRKPAGDPVLNPAASFPVGVPALSPNNILTTPTPLPAPRLLTTTQGPGKGTFLAGKPQNPEKSNDPEPQAEPEPSLQDVCSHPFHSFLCSTPRRRSNPTPASPSAKNLVATPPFLLSQIKAKPQKEQGSLPAPRPPRHPQCDHPFHSWLCDRRPDKPKKHQGRGHTRPPGRSKIANTVTDPAASLQDRNHSTTASSRSVPTVPSRTSIDRRRHASATLPSAPSIVHRVVSAVPLPWLDISVSSPSLTSPPIDPVASLFDGSRPSPAPPAAEAH